MFFSCLFQQFDQCHFFINQFEETKEKGDNNDIKLNSEKEEIRKEVKQKTKIKSENVMQENPTANLTPSCNWQCLLSR